MSDQDRDPPPPTRRRALLDLALGATGAGLGAMAAYPVARYLTPPRAGAGAGRVVVCRTSELPAGSAKLVRAGDDPVLVVAGPDGELRAFVARCPHMGCVLRYAGERGQIACDCHAGRFSLEGRVLAGPPPGPLRPVPVEVVGDDVVVGRG